MTAKKRPVGRPTKYTNDIPDLFLKSMQAGNSVLQFAASIGVTRSTVYKWADEIPEFSDIFEQGKEYAEAYWETKYQMMMYMRDVNSPLVKLYFANRFKWHDRPADSDNDDQGQPVQITFEVNEAVKDIKVTKGTRDD